MTDPFQNMASEDKVVLDLLSVSALLGSLVNFLPAVAALFTIVWTGIRIYETQTVRGLLKRRKGGEQD
jgi:hypothetical protein